MNRRGFIQISSVALLPLLLGIFPKRRKEVGAYTISVESNRKFGHLIRETSQCAPSREITTDYAIIGGGIAGLSAATQLNGKDFLLFEASEKLGGSSASGAWKDTYFSTGAHYDLAYPTNFGSEVIELLKALNIVQFNPHTELYEFVDEKYVIPANSLEQCFWKGDPLKDALEGAKGVEEFKAILHQFEGKMPLPTRLIAEEFHYLDRMSFTDFLSSKMKLEEDLERRISYQMLDDWGGKCNEISALAGIHYYMCRPYEEKDVQVFSPPNGNSYFIEKMVGSLENLNAIHVNTLARSIRETENGVEIEIITPEKEIVRVNAKHLIYAGQKHTLNYLLKTEKPLFTNSYAPWMVINFVCKKGIEFATWQNDVLTNELEFLGFVNSTKQKTRSEEHDVFTAYYCFSEKDIARLVAFEENPEAIIQATLQLIERETNRDLTPHLEHVNIHLMGHAMPIPKPNYLSFKDVPSYSKNIVFAGVDTGRLPLFYEACDSGIQAARKLLTIDEITTT